MKFSVDQLQVLDVRSGLSVEVSYGEGGLKGLWYRAIIESKSTRGLRKLSVRLLKDDFATPLDQLSKNVSVRPVPPHHLQVRIDLKEGCVVDACHNDEWWTGLLIKEIEDQKYLVYFDSSPPDIIQVEREFLRPHFEWVYSKWWEVPKSKSQLLERWREKSIFSPGTKVEVSSNIDNMETVWAPALIVKEIAEEDNEKKYIVKFCNDVSLNCKDSKANVTIDSQSIRPKPPPFWVEEYKMFERVEVFHGSKWHKGILKGIISQKQYMVSLEVTKTHMIFDYSDLRPIMEWEDGVRKENSKNNNRKRKREETLSYISIVEELNGSDTTMVLPSEKKLPIWKKFESMEVFKTFPQNPHFRPLFETSEYSPETLAVGMRLTFSRLVEDVKNLQLFNPVSRLEGINDLFSVLEKHGFDVKVPQSRIHKLLSLKDKQSKKMEELKGIEKDSEKVEIEQKILELKRRKEYMDKEIGKMESCEQ